MPTNKRERVYIYASKTPADEDAWDEIGMQISDNEVGLYNWKKNPGAEVTAFRRSWGRKMDINCGGDLETPSPLQIPFRIGTFNHNST
jgi:hypothetical protein